MLLVIFHRKYWMKCQLFHLSTSITRVDHTNLSHQKLPITFSLVTRYKHKMSKTLTLFDCKSALMACKMPPTPQKFCDFSYFYMTYLKSKKKFFGDFGSLEGGGGEQPLNHLTYIFNPTANRVKAHLIDLG